ncbi:NAD(P)-binding domain-containing protein [Acidisoma sp. 7E03]
MQIGFIGLGGLGSTMALNLVTAGHDVRAGSWPRLRRMATTVRHCLKPTRR